MARKVLRISLVVALTLALAPRAALWAQGFGDPTSPGGMSGFSSNNPAGMNPVMMNNSPYIATGPTAPTNPTRPESWPGGSQDPARGPQPGAPGTSTEAAPQRPLGDPPYDPAEIMARVGAETVQATELLPAINQQMAKIKVQYADQFAALPPKQREAELLKVQKQLMEHSVKDMINLKLVLAEVHQTVPAEGLKKTEKSIRDFFNSTVIKQLLIDYKATNVSELEDKLHEVGSSLDTQRNVFVEQQMVVSWMKEKVKEEKEPTHEQMLAFYQEHHADWETPAKARWEQLSLRFANYPTKADAWKALAQLGRQIQQGAPFAGIAKAHSQDFAAEEGGQHDWTGQGSLRSTVLDWVVFSLPVGALSQIVEDDEGLHIVRVLDRQDAKRTPFSEVQPEIKRRMQLGNENKQRLAYLAKLRERTPVWTVFDDPAASPVATTAAATGPDAPVAR